MSSMMSPGMHPVLCALRVIDEGLDELVEANLWSLLDGESLEVLRESHRLLARMTAVASRATREVDIRGAAVSPGATSLTAWPTNVGRIHPGAAAREVRLAAALDRDLPVTAAALGAGEITPAAVAVIAETDQALGKFATAADRAQAEATLAELARTLPVRGLQNAALHLGHRLDPDQGDGLRRRNRTSWPGGSSGCDPTPTGPRARTATWTRRPPRCCVPRWTRWPSLDRAPTGSATRAAPPNAAGTPWSSSSNSPCAPGTYPPRPVNPSNSWSPSGSPTSSPG
jgi:hypothetical protein